MTIQSHSEKQHADSSKKKSRKKIIARSALVKNPYM